ncbi:sugar ABC transporter permease [Thermoanaerobacterium thermosaccharolyticum]|uniref:carbohydrate ABC transporter permease n=1 Tax=Thermoanaerobacterium thermosaccharolyticum TaxID=1517 RepID=UPI003D2C830F
MAIRVIYVNFLAGLKQIPKNLYEASLIDGASSWQNFTKITLPMLSPVIFFNLVLQLINSFREFNSAYIVTQGGPMNPTLLYVLYVYNNAFSYSQMGYSCALAWILVIIIAIFSVFIFKSQTKWVYYEDR